MTTLWLTGLSGAGKSTLARALLPHIPDSFVIDGDEARAGINSDLRFSQRDRQENVRRLGEVAIILNQAGVVPIVAAISPYSLDRAAVRARHEELGLKLIEIYVATPLVICEQRDPKSLYRAARSGVISSFTGVSDVYEPPKSPSVVVSTYPETVEASVYTILSAIHVGTLVGDDEPKLAMARRS
jgi:adenylyl-sulfate kinase